MQFFSKFAAASRLPFIVASMLPVLLASSLAYRAGIFSLQTFALCLLGAVLAHLGTNLSNDYFDYKYGNYPKKKTGPSGGSFAIQSGVFSDKQILLMAGVCFLLSLAIFGLISAYVGFNVLALAVLGAAIGFFYTAPPLRLGYNYLGELSTIIGL